MKLKSMAETLSLVQLIDSATRIQGNTHNLRDIILVSSPQTVKQCGILPSFSNLDHFPVFASFAIPNHKPAMQTQVPIWDYARTDIDQLVNILAHTDWDAIAVKDIDEAIEALTLALLDAADKCIPTKTVRVRHSKPWVSSELRREMRKRDRLFRKARETGDNNDWTRWKKQRALVTKLNRQLKEEKRNKKLDLLLQNKQNPHKYHQILKDIAGFKGKDQIPPIICGDNFILEEKMKAKVFNEYFCEQTNIEINNSHHDYLHEYLDNHPRTQHKFEHTNFTPLEVLRCINKMDASKACGPDNIPTKVLKMCAAYIAEPLATIFNKSIRGGKYPTMWKTANVKPIYKGKGSPSDVKNFRPISLLPCISKVFEKLMFRRIYEHITSSSLLSQRQSGYRPGHNTQLQLVYLTDKLYKSLDSSSDFTIIYLDIARYFEKIWHDGLIAKCQVEFGFADAELNWLKSYLSGRNQSVQVGTQRSHCRQLNAGVPQGSVLGPLLAIMYLNSLGNLTENEMLFFADDSSIFAKHSADNARETEASLQRDLNAIHAYGNKWVITFNANKTSQQTFSNRSSHYTPHLLFGTQEIPHNSNHKHLGLTMSTDLRFKSHINNVLLKFNRAMSPLYPIASKIPRNVLLTIYKVYVQPHLDYCASVYDGHITVFDRARLEKAQSRAARLITGAPRRTSSAGLLEELGWSTLDSRRQSTKLLLYQKLRFDNTVPTYIKDITPNTRTQDTTRLLRSTQADIVTEPHAQTHGYRRSFIPNATKLWNELPSELRQTAVNSSLFRKHLKQARAPKLPNKYFCMGSRKGNILHTRLRLKSSLLNAHLYAKGKAESPRCHCGHPREDTQHFLLTCPVYTIPRTVFLRKLSNLLHLNFSLLSRTQQVKLIIDGPDGDVQTKRATAIATQTYLLHTQRL